MAERPTAWPSQEAGIDASRADARRNRSRLLEAGEQLLAGQGSFKLAEAAKRAGVSTATAYRHFHSADDLVDALVAGFWDVMDERAAALGGSHHLLRDLCIAWVEAVLDWGPILVVLRSRRGLLQRRAAGDLRVVRLTRVIEPGLAAEQASVLGRPPSADESSYLLAVWNALADPREILDQHATLAWSARRIADSLHRSVRVTIDAPDT